MCGKKEAEQAQSVRTEFLTTTQTLLFTNSYIFTIWLDRLGITPCLAADSAGSLNPAIRNTVALGSPVLAFNALVYTL